MNPWLELLKNVKALNIPGQLDELAESQRQTFEKQEDFIRHFFPEGL